MRDRPGPTIAFVVWNPFQLLHVLALARSLPGSMIVVERRPEHIDELPDELVTTAPVPVLFWAAERMVELDGKFDVIVCQTPFSQIELFERTRIAMVQYGLAKEPHNYGAWRSLADLCLTYGAYSARKVSHFCPALAVGNPRLDTWGTPAFEETARARYGELLDRTVPTVLYVPTWGELSTQEQFLDAVLSLSAHYNVLVKLHHNTSMLEPHRRREVSRARVHYLDAADDLLALFAVSDVVLSDYSGAVFDALYCERPVVLLQSGRADCFGAKLDEHSLEYAERRRVGPVVTEPAQLGRSVEQVLRGELSYRAQNRELVAELYVPSPGASERAAKALVDLAQNRIAPRTQLQGYVRDEVRAARQQKPALRIPGLRGRATRVQTSAADRHQPKVQDFERTLLEGWLRKGHYARVLTYVELRVRALPRIYIYRVGIRAALALGDQQRLDRLIARAKRDFPQARFAHVTAPAAAANPTHPNGYAPEKRHKRVLSRVPYLAYAPIAAAYALSFSKRTQTAAALLRELPARSPVERDILLHSLVQKSGDAPGAYEVVALAQKHHPGDARILLRLAECLRERGQYEAAHVVLRLVADKDPLHGRIQLLEFESAMCWYELGRATLARLLEQDRAALLRLRAELESVAAPYPEYRETLRQLSE